MDATTTRERPILFSAPMVRAILAGAKTQTRRTRGLDNTTGAFWDHRGWEPVVEDGMIDRWRSLDGDYVVREGAPRPRCPYGAPGDRLWVRETWACSRDFDDQPIAGKLSESDTIWWREGCADAVTGMPSLHGRWRPSIHMPRRACRIVLDLTDVRVQRLHDASDADLVAEGLKVCPPNGDRDATAYVFPDSGYDRSGLCHSSPDVAFAEGWDGINGDGAYEANPWVWALTFKRVT